MAEVADFEDGSTRRTEFKNTTNTASSKKKPNVLNSNSKYNMILKIEFGSPLGSGSRVAKYADYIFPINPEQLSINQTNRVNPVFAYGTQVYQNLGKGVKTIQFSGHTAFNVKKQSTNWSPVGSSLTRAAKEFDTTITTQKSTATEEVTIVNQRSGITNVNTFVDENTNTDTNNKTSAGKENFLDLYSFIGMLKGENKFYGQGGMVGTADLPSYNYSVRNLRQIKTVKIIIPDHGIVYDVILQSDSFQRSRTEPHLYRYNLSFYVTNEYLWDGAKAEEITKPDIYNSKSRTVGLGKDDKSSWMDKVLGKINAGVTAAADKAKKLMNSIQGSAAFGYISQAVSYATGALNIISSIQLEMESSLVSINNAVTGRANSMSAIREGIYRFNNCLVLCDRIIEGCDNYIASIAGLAPSKNIYETKVQVRNIKGSYVLLRQNMELQREYLKEVLVMYTALMGLGAGVGNLVTSGYLMTGVAGAVGGTVGLGVMYYNHDVYDTKKNTVPQQSNPIRNNNGVSTVDIDSLSQHNITSIEAYAPNDYEETYNLISSVNENRITFIDTFDNIGTKFRFVIKTKDDSQPVSIDSLKYKSIKKVKIKAGETLQDILERNTNEELNDAGNSYVNIVAKMNNVEYPYVYAPYLDGYDGGVSYQHYIDNYAGSYAVRAYDMVFFSREDFINKIANVNLNTSTASLPLYEFDAIKDTMKIRHSQIDRFLEGKKFFNLIFKDMYSDRLYNVFGIFDNGGAYGDLWLADKYIICGIEKGKKYNLSEDSYLEILSEYNMSQEFIEVYGQSDYLDSLPQTDSVYEKLNKIVKNVYNLYLGTYSSSTWDVFTEPDPDIPVHKVFLAGDDNNLNSVLIRFLVNVESDKLLSLNKYSILTTNDYISLPMLSSNYLPFGVQDTEDGNVYKADINSDFANMEIQKFTNNRSSLEIDFAMISGVPNVKQAIKNRINCPSGGLRLHNEYGLPDLVGTKNTAESTILLRYYLYEQMIRENRVKSVGNISINANGDSIVANVNAVLVNDDEVSIR